MSLDKFIQFTFNGISSSRFNVIYTNNGGDLSFPAVPSFSNETVTPIFQKRSYLLGTNIEQRQFQFKCWASDLTLAQYREMLKWLDIETVGPLQLDFNSDYYFNVKVASISDPIMYPREVVEEKQMTILGGDPVSYTSNTIYYNLEFTITFETVNDFAAISIDTYSFIAKNDTSYNMARNYDYEYRLPVVDLNPPRNTTDYYSARIFNHAPYPLYPSFKIFGADYLKIEVRANDVSSTQPPWYKYDLTSAETLYNVFINGEYGFVLNNNTQELIESETAFLNNLTTQEQFINRGQLAIMPNNIFQTTMAVDPTGFDRDDTNYRLSISFIPSDLTDNATYFRPYGNVDYYDINHAAAPIENSYFKSVFIQDVNDLGLILYGEGEYNTGVYYISDTYTFVSYYFYSPSINVFKCMIQSDAAGYDRLIKYFNPDQETSSDYNQKFVPTSEEFDPDLLVSIGNYTQIIYYITANEVLKDNTETEFRLRTTF